jgi:hypothetical protein
MFGDSDAGLLALPVPFWPDNEAESVHATQGRLKSSSKSILSGGTTVGYISSDRDCTAHQQNLENSTHKSRGSASTDQRLLATKLQDRRYGPRGYGYRNKLGKISHFYDITHAILYFPMVALRKYHLGRNTMDEQL